VLNTTVKSVKFYYLFNPLGHSEEKCSRIDQKSATQIKAQRLYVGSSIHPDFRRRDRRNELADDFLSVGQRRNYGRAAAGAFLCLAYVNK